MATVANAAILPQYYNGQNAQLSEQYAEEDNHYDHHPRYKFAYEVHDSHTGDIKSQQEERDGDTVNGSYSLIDADGYKRIVHYTAGKHIGFHATVHREPIHHQIPIKTILHQQPLAINTQYSYHN